MTTMVNYTLLSPGRPPVRVRSKPRSLRVIHPNAAGIDIGSTAHYVAVPADRSDASVRRFGCLTPQLHEMARWLKACGITTVAMEATGVYWVPVMQVLEPYGLEVIVVNAGHVKNVPGRKSDVLDCQWLQDLHTFGLLRGSFMPDPTIRVLRTYWRQREDLVEQAARQIQKMQKALEQMNLQIHKLLSDLSGVSGLAILRAILAGERDPVALAALAHVRVKSPRPMIAQALTGEYREELVFVLGQAVELYDVFRQKIADLDARIESHLATVPARPPLGQGQRHAPAPGNPASAPARRGKGRKPRKNQVAFDLRSHLIRICGVDLTGIDGIDSLTAQTLISECGIDLRAFPTEKHFASWLGLCPNHRITGGKIKSRRTKKLRHRAADALRLAAQSLHHSKSALGAFFRRIKGKLGVEKAITATAHKLARLVYQMLTHGQAYVDQGQVEYERKYQERQVRSLHKNALRMGYRLIDAQTGEFVS